MCVAFIATRRAISRPISHRLKNEKGKGKEPEKNKHSYKHGMRATWGHSEDEISSSDEEMTKPICFMSIGNAAKVRPRPHLF